MLIAHAVIGNAFTTLTLELTTRTSWGICFALVSCFVTVVTTVILPIAQVKLAYAFYIFA